MMLVWWSHFICWNFRPSEIIWLFGIVLHIYYYCYYDHYICLIICFVFVIVWFYIYIDASTYIIKFLAGFQLVFHFTFQMLFPCCRELAKFFFVQFSFWLISVSSQPSLLTSSCSAYSFFFLTLFSIYDSAW